MTAQAEPRTGESMLSRLGEARLERRVAPGDAWAYEVAAGEYVQLIDVEGKQCTDFLAFNGHDHGDEMNLTIARKGRSHLAHMIWRQANLVGLAFRTMITDAPPESDLDARLRRSEKKKRQLQRRINQLLGEG